MDAHLDGNRGTPTTTHSPNRDSDTWGYKATHWVIKRRTLGYKRHIGVFSPLQCVVYFTCEDDLLPDHIQIILSQRKGRSTRVLFFKLFLYVFM